MTETVEKFNQLIRIIKKLREPDGCPWDQKQTPQTFKTYLIEEMYELVEAIQNDTPQEIKEELGDLLFQIIFINNLYQEEGHFTLADVIESISEKMVRRHPHVFGDLEISSEEELRKQWHTIKANEKNKKTTLCDQLNSVPKSLPALRRANRIIERVTRSGFVWPNQASIIKKLDEEIDELKEALATNKTEKCSEELGDILFTVASLSRFIDINPEDALHGTINKFTNRFERFEKDMERSKIKLADIPQDTLQTLWQKAKRN